MRCSKEVVVSKIITWIAKTWQMRESILGRGQETLRKVLGQLWDNLGTILKQLGTILIQLWDSFENTYLACKDLADEGKYPWTRSRNTVTDQEEGSTEDWKRKKVANKAKNTTPSSPLITIINGYQRQYSWSDRRGEIVLFCVHTFIMFLTKTEDQNSRVLTWERSDSKRWFETKPALINLLTKID